MMARYSKGGRWTCGTRRTLWTSCPYSSYPAQGSSYIAFVSSLYVSGSRIGLVPWDYVWLSFRFRSHSRCRRYHGWIGLSVATSLGNLALPSSSYSFAEWSSRGSSFCGGYLPPIAFVASSPDCTLKFLTISSLACWISTISNNNGSGSHVPCGFPRCERY